MLLSEHFQPLPIQPDNHFNKLTLELSTLLVKRHNSYKLQHFIMPDIIYNNMQYLIKSFSCINKTTVLKCFRLFLCKS